MTPIGSSAFAALGDAILPSVRSVFTPAAFEASKNITDRALRGRQALQSAVRLSAAESQFRRAAMDEQEMGSRTRQMAQEEELYAMQPLLRKDMSDIDITDDDAFERLASMESSVISPSDRRRLSALRVGASAVAREKAALLDKLQVLGDPREAEAIYGGALEGLRSGDAMALRKASLGLPTYNEQASQQAEEARIRAERRQELAKSQQELEDAAKDLFRFGGGARDQAGISANLRRNLEPILQGGAFNSLDRSLLEKDPATFKSAVIAATNGDRELMAQAKVVAEEIDKSMRASSAAAQIKAATAARLRAEAGMAEGASRTGMSTAAEILAKLRQPAQQ